MVKTLGFLLLSLSGSGALMIVLIFLVNYIFRKKISFQWQYYIWLFALARLLLPFAPEENFIGKVWEWTEGQIQISQQQKTKDIGGQKIDTSEAQDNSKIQKINDSGVGQQNEKEDLKSQVSFIENSKNNLGNREHFWDNLWNGRKYLIVFYCVIVIMLFIRKMTLYQSFVRYVKTGSVPVSDIDFLEELSGIEADLGMQKPVELWINPLISSPMLLGMLHPVIVLPKDMLSEKAFSYTVLHELTHQKRYDIAYKWLVQLVVCIHWFNPFVYLMEKSVSRLCELSCDEAVIRRFSDKEQCREYGETLLEAMHTEGTYKESLACMTLSENKKLLKERLEAIMNHTNLTVKRKVLIAVLTVAICTSTLYSGCYRVGATNNTANQESAQKNVEEGTSPQKGESAEENARRKTARKKSDKVTAEQVDKMALALTDKTWVWEWIAFFVPYMSEDGVDKLIPASKKSEWAGSIDYTTGKKIRFTKKQVNAARNEEVSGDLTCRDIDKHARNIMKYNGNWEYISDMLPYMSRSGIRTVVRIYNQKTGKNKRAKDYY